MKILPVEIIRELDAHTIKHEPIKSIDLMERASKAFVQWFVSKVTVEKSICIVAGIGNNGGDGLAVARLLLEKGFKVSVVVVGDESKGSDDFKENLKRLTIKPKAYSKDLLPNTEIIIDAIFGSGLTRPVKDGIFADAINEINTHQAEVVSIDTPSGLFADKPTPSKTIVKATATISFQLPKLVFMMPETFEYVGRWHIVDIGLDSSFINNSSTNNFYITASDVKPLIKIPLKYDHKGSNGHAFLVAGSYGKMGAVVLAANAALRSGLGLLTIQVPKSGNDIVQSSVPEAMTSPDVYDNLISLIDIEGEYSSIGIGPGLGKDPITKKAISKFLNENKQPLVLDADALNIISENRELLQVIPENSILTPHPKEFYRLVGKSWNDDFEKLELLKQLSIKLKSVVLIKGAHTVIASPDGQLYFNSTGNPGMAKGGSGDILTGIITGLLAQGYSSLNATIIGVYLHGLAGDMASHELGEIAMNAGDILDFIPEAYSHLC